MLKKHIKSKRATLTHYYKVLHSLYPEVLVKQVRYFNPPKKKRLRSRDRTGLRLEQEQTEGNFT